MIASIEPSSLYLAAAAVAGFAMGALVSYLLGSVGHRPLGKRADKLHHTIRALEADLRVAQRTAEQARSDRESLSAGLDDSATELATLRTRVAGHDALVRKLRAEIQHECAKTARLRQELADRAEEMVRTSVQLRDVQNELGVSQVGSDVVIDQINSLERERDDLASVVTALRAELAARQARQPPSGTSSTLDQGDDLLVDN